MANLTSGLDLKAVVKSFGDITVVQQVNLAVLRRDFLV
jgi:ABC-type sugar transport system ATPase subunit